MDDQGFIRPEIISGVTSTLSLAVIDESYCPAWKIPETTITFDSSPLAP